MKMITDKFEFKKELVIENFKIKLDILNSMIESGFISESVLIGVCYLDYLSAIFYPNDKANNGRFCRLLQEKGKRDIWSAFYPDLYNQYTKKPINFDTESEFITYKAAEKCSNGEDLFKGTLAHFLYKNLRCIAVHERFISDAGDIKIPIECISQGIFITYRYLGVGTLLDSKNTLGIGDIVEEIEHIIQLLNELEIDNFKQFILS